MIDPTDTKLVCFIILALAYLIYQGRIFLRLKGLIHSHDEAVPHHKSDEKSKTGGFEWCNWVITKCSVSNGVTLSAYRDVAMNELEQLLMDDRDYLTLNRLGTAAPLLGVMFTAYSFYSFQMPNDADRLGELMPLLGPLAVGVGAGALLAIINQYLLRQIDYYASCLRATCRKWLDEVILPGLQNKEDVPDSLFEHLEKILGKHAVATDDLKAVTTTVRDTTAQMHLSMSALTVALGVHESASKAFERALNESLVPGQERMVAAADRIDTAVAGLGGKLESLGSAVSAISEKLQEATTTFAALASASNTFQTTIESEFTPAASKYNAIANSLTAILTSCETSTAQLVISSEQVRKLTGDCCDATTRYHDSVMTSLLPTHTILEQSTRNFDATAKLLHNNVERLNAALPTASNSIESILRSTTASISEIEKASTRLSTAVEGNLTNSLTGLVSAASSVSTAASKVAAAGTSIDDNMKVLTGGIQQHVTVQQAIVANLSLVHDVVDKLKSGATALNADLTNHAIPSQRAFVSATTAMEETAKRLAELVDKAYGPTIDKLKELDAVFGRLQTAVRSLEPVFASGKASDALVESMKSLARSVDAISRLPAELKDALKPASPNGQGGAKPPHKQSLWQRLVGS